VFPLLPVRVWFVVLRVLWLLDWATGAEPRAQVLARARLAARRLAAAAEPDKLVVLVGHGIFMALVSRALESMGWARLDPLPRRPWSACCFEPPLASAIRTP
jgi:broad specificity phosphatase PhoE